MSNAFIFAFGVIVTIMVGAAVGLLVWGASQEKD